MASAQVLHQDDAPPFSPTLSRKMGTNCSQAVRYLCSQDKQGTRLRYKPEAPVKAEIMSLPALSFAKGEPTSEVPVVYFRNGLSFLRSKSSILAVWERQLRTENMLFIYRFSSFPGVPCQLATPLHEFTPK